MTHGWYRAEKLIERVEANGRRMLKAGTVVAAEPPASAAPMTRRPIMVGLIGRGIQQSRTPAMHEGEARALGLDFTYRLLDTDTADAPLNLSDLLRYAEFLGFTGFNVTYPYKQEIVPLLDELSPAAHEIGSVNTVVLRDGRRYGHNTDRWGFAESFRREVPATSGDTVLLIGAGGAGGAVANALVECGVGRLIIHDTDTARAKTLVARLVARFGAGTAEPASDLGAAAHKAAGIVNTTPVGMAKLPGSPIPLDMVAPRHWVTDIIYFPLETELLAEARRKGCRTLGGEGMAVFQAVRAFELFTGVKPDPDRMKVAFAAFDGEPAGPALETNRLKQGGMP